MKNHFEAAFNKGTARYGFIRTELPPLAEYEAYSRLSDEEGERLIKLISPTGKVICLGMDSTIMAVLASRSMAVMREVTDDPSRRARRIAYINRVFGRADAEGRWYTPAQIQGGDHLMVETGIVQSDQWGIEILGETAENADAEVLAAAMTILAEAGLPRESLRLEIGDARWGSWLMNQLGLQGQEKRSRAQQWLEDKNLQALMAEGYGPLAALASAFGEFKSALGVLKQKLGSEGIMLSEVADDLERLKIKLEHYGLTEIHGDFGTTNRYHYYSSFIYRIYTRDSGKLLATGGRYDQMDGSAMYGCGLTFNSENILEVLEMNSLKKKSIWAACESDYTILWKEDNDQRSIQVAESLRNMGFRVLVKYDASVGSQTMAETGDSKCLVWVDGDCVKAVDGTRNTCYQGSIENFIQREERKNYDMSIH